jgi:hypothetical protein
VGSVIDSVDDNDSFNFQNFVHDAIGTSPSGMETGEFALQESANSVRVFDKRAEHELDDGDRNVFGKPVQLALGKAGSTKLVVGILDHGTMPAGLKTCPATSLAKITSLLEEARPKFRAGYEVAVGMGLLGFPQFSHGDGVGK